MNYTISTASWENATLKANYCQYDNDDNALVRALAPVQGDAAAPAAATDNTPFGFNRKDLEISGIWFFTKKSSIKAGYDALWMDRTDRDFSHSLDNTFFVSGDCVPIRDLLPRLSYRHLNRTPDAYQDDQVASLTPLNFLTGAAATVGPYYLYGLQKDISYNYGFDAGYAYERRDPIPGNSGPQPRGRRRDFQIQADRHAYAAHRITLSAMGQSGLPDHGDDTANGLRKSGFSRRNTTELQLPDSEQCHIPNALTWPGKPVLSRLRGWRSVRRPFVSG